MHWMSYMHGRMPSWRNQRGRRRQMRYRPQQVHIMRNVRGDMPSWRNRTRINLETITKNTHNFLLWVFF